MLCKHGANSGTLSKLRLNQVKPDIMKRFLLILLISYLHIGFTHAQRGYDKIGRFGTHGLAWALVKKDNKYGFINTQGEEVVPVQYDNIGKFGTHGIAWALVQKDNKYGFMNTQGEEVVPVQYDKIGKFGTHGIAWALVQKDNKYGFINTQGEVVIPIKHNSPGEIEVKENKLK
jgi:hypothetical protein